MQLTSEVENILNGTIERRNDADKAIGVSTANLIPDAKGEVPLSKQGSFVILPANNQTPQLETPVMTEVPAPVLENPLTTPEAVAPEVVPTTTSEPSVVDTPITPTPEVPAQTLDAPLITPGENVTPEVPATPMVTQEPAVVDAPVTPTPEVPAQTLETPAISPETSVVPEVPVAEMEPLPVEGVLQESPVSVESPEKLESIEMPSISDTPFLQETQQPQEQEQPLVDIPMPTMPDTILAQEPGAVDENLFNHSSNNEPVVAENNGVQPSNKELIQDLEKLKSDINTLINNYEELLKKTLSNSITDEISEEVKQTIDHSLPELNTELNTGLEQPLQTDAVSENIIDPLSQIENTEIPSIDNTQIQGGKFV